MSVDVVSEVVSSCFGFAAGVLVSVLLLSSIAFPSGSMGRGFGAVLDAPDASFAGDSVSGCVGLVGAVPVVVGPGVAVGAGTTLLGDAIKGGGTELGSVDSELSVFMAVI